MTIKISQRHVLRRDKWLLSCLTWVPILLSLTIWGVFSAGIARDLPIGVVDLQHSQLSRKLIQMLDASSTLSVDYYYTSANEAKNAMIEGDIYAFAVIPSKFDQDILLHRQPQLSVFFNSQYILVAKLINSAVAQAQGYFDAQVQVMGNLAKGNTTTLAALGQAVPVSTQITALFNRNTNYAQFLVTAIVPAIWQICIVVSTILILAAHFRIYGGKNGFEFLGNKPYIKLSAILSQYIPVFMLQGALFLYWFYVLLEWPMEGSLVVMLLAQFVTVVACIIMGALFFFLSMDPARAMSFAGAFTAPSFAFMGITFPVSDMNTLTHAWRSLLPITHYIEVQVGQASYGASAAQSFSALWPMIWYVVPLLLTAAFIHKYRAAALSTQQREAA
ncbi:ABC transporter permease [Vibrio parahaemolyticus]|uniref:ABC transporter permease n=2 Tax=Vibrio parahaemolyticus TaxID=670 RepID=UPI000996BE2F|nr:ABC transporter permease [Vibrio parahaemolyticus]EJG0874929.1 ABC transporter permease [Vibrio parahaemolyticus O3]EJG0903557.1 ABC transporter permease [Vibrio parahaemolyticus O3:K56]EJG1075769.1 ABC transporter permease [Vibrio parahaemolyticus O1:K56]EGQ8275866.1 ABC transporter permease [Vibrio parahaemolyticus]EGR1974471.1 ABC transporter permease [Vibrio parahaemolyticus]